MRKKIHYLGEPIEKQAMDEKREVGGQVETDPWRKSRNLGEMENSDGHACLSGSCGDSIEIFLRFDDERVCEASYFTDGCRSSHLCGSSTVDMALGKSPVELTEVTAEAVLKEIGTDPRVEEHCAFLASAVLQEAVRDYMQRQTKGGD